MPPRIKVTTLESQLIHLIQELSGRTLTAVVFAATFIFTAQNNWPRVAYILLLCAALLLDIIPSTITAELAHYASGFLIAVTSLHSIERFWWHVVWDQPFPDFGRTEP